MHLNMIRTEAPTAPTVARSLTPKLHIAMSPAAEEYLKKRDRPVALDYIAALG